MGKGGWPYQAGLMVLIIEDKAITIAKKIMQDNAGRVHNLKEIKLK